MDTGNREGDKKVITRRDFMRAGSCVAIGSLMGLSLLGNSPRKKTGKSRVVLIRDETILDSHLVMFEFLMELGTSPEGFMGREGAQRGDWR